MTQSGKLTRSSRIINSNLLQKRFFPWSEAYAGIIIFCPRSEDLSPAEKSSAGSTRSAGRLGNSWRNMYSEYTEEFVTVFGSSVTSEPTSLQNGRYIHHPSSAGPSSSPASVQVIRWSFPDRETTASPWLSCHSAHRQYQSAINLSRSILRRYHSAHKR